MFKKIMHSRLPVKLMRLFILCIVLRVLFLYSAGMRSIVGDIHRALSHAIGVCLAASENLDDDYVEDDDSHIFLMFY